MTDHGGFRILDVRMASRWDPRLKLAVGWVTLFTVGTDLFVVSPLLPSISRQFAVVPSQAGLVVAVFSMFYAIAAPGLGVMADKFGKRPILVLGLVGFTAANALTSLAGSFLWLVASRGLAGLSAAAVTPSVYAVIGDMAPAQYRGAWLAIVGSGLLMALWVGAPIGTVAAHITHWSMVFGGLAAVTALLSVVNLLVWPSHPASARSANLRAAPGDLRMMVTHVSTTLLWGAAVYGFYTYLGTGLRLDGRFTTGLVAAGLVTYGVGATAGSLFGGRLADRWGSGRVVRASLIALAVVLAFVGALLHARVGLLLVLPWLSFTGYAFFPAFQAELAASFPKHRGKIMAWNNTALYMGITLGSLIGGWVAQQSFQALPFVCAVIALVNALLSLRRSNAVSSTVQQSASTSRHP
jgi:DHA1 family purine base/nucleoside efflux pump-like MFS transporter